MKTFKELLQQISEETKSLSDETSREAARIAGNEIGIDWSKVDFDEFYKGMGVEQEHADITKGSPKETAKIVRAHIFDIPDYYTRLIKMEKEAAKA